MSSQAPCTTERIPLPGAPVVTKQMVEKAANERGLTVETVTHLTTLYGSRFTEVLDLLKQNPGGARRLCPHCPDILAQVRHALEYEGALTVEDFLLRRSLVGLGPCQGLDALDSVADEMGRLLGWSQAERQKQIDLYRGRVAMRMQFKAKLHS